MYFVYAFVYFMHVTPLLVEGAGQSTATAFDADLDSAGDIFMDGDELKMFKQMVKVNVGSKLGRASMTIML